MCSRVRSVCDVTAASFGRSPSCFVVGGMNARRGVLPFIRDRLPFVRENVRGCGSFIVFGMCCCVLDVLEVCGVR